MIHSIFIAQIYFQMFKKIKSQTKIPDQANRNPKKESLGENYFPSSMVRELKR